MNSRGWLSRLPHPIARELRRAAYAYRRWSFRPYQIQYRYPDGVDIPFLVGDPIARVWYDMRVGDGGRSEGWYLIADGMVQPDDLVLECGAHHGLTTIFLAKRARQVLAIEANPRNVDITRRNLNLNGLDSAVHCAAVSDHSGVKVHLKESSNASLACLAGVPTFTAEAVTIDDFCSAHGFRPTVLKVDIEGAEVLALSAAQQTLRLHPKLNIEVHCREIRSDFGRSPDDILAALPLDRYRWDIQLSDQSSEVIEVRPPFSISQYDRIQLWGWPLAPLGGGA